MEKRGITFCAVDVCAVWEKVINNDIYCCTGEIHLFYVYNIDFFFLLLVVIYLLSFILVVFCLFQNVYLEGWWPCFTFLLLYKLFIVVFVVVLECNRMKFHIIFVLFSIEILFSLFVCVILDM